MSFASQNTCIRYKQKSEFDIVNNLLYNIIMTQSLTLGDSPQEDRIAVAETFNLTPETLEAIWQELYDVECRGSGEKAFDEEMFRRLLSNPKAILVLMRSLQDNKLIGYTLANPDEDEEDGKTSYIESTAIVPEFQRKKHVALLI